MDLKRSFSSFSSKGREDVVGEDVVGGDVVGWEVDPLSSSLNGTCGERFGGFELRL